MSIRPLVTLKQIPPVVPATAILGPVGQLPSVEDKPAEVTPPQKFERMQDIPDGTQVPFSYEGEIVMGTKIGYRPEVNKAIIMYAGRRHQRVIHGYGKATPRVSKQPTAATNGTTLMSDGVVVKTGEAYTPTVAVVTVPQPSRFDVDTRFEFIADMTDMVATGESKSLIVSGDGGLGKTYIVIQRCKAAGLVSDDEANGEPDAKPDLRYGDAAPKEDKHGEVAIEQAPAEDEEEIEESMEDEIKDALEGKKKSNPYDYCLVKGFSTPKAMYRHLYVNKTKLTIFDDCDSVMEHATSINLLKSALDSYEDRWIHWLSELDDGLPNRFKFTGKIIFVSNKRLDQIPQTLLSRGLYVDVSMSMMDKITRIRTLSKHMRPDMTAPEKEEVLVLLDTFKERIGDLNLRTFLKVCELRHQSPKRWRDMAEYVVTAKV